MFVEKSYSSQSIDSNSIQYIFAMSDGCSTRIVATPVFVQQKQEFIMENLNPLKSFLSDLITPIVEKAVKDAVPAKEGTSLPRYIPVSQIPEEYGISVSTIYLRFSNGELTKHKQGGLTFVDREELEKSIKAKKMYATVAPKKK